LKVTVGEYVKDSRPDFRPELNKGGMFSGSFITYKIKVDGLGWCVKRKFSDFTTIRNILKKMHPGIPVKNFCILLKD
jgi:hypothetical protein